MTWGIYGSYEVGILSEPIADAAYTPTVVAAAAADLFIFTARRPMRVVGLGIEITTTYVIDVADTAQVVSLDHRVTHNSNVGRVELAEIELVTGWADGDVKYQLFNGVDLEVGQQLVLEQKVQGVNGGAGVLAGALIPFALWYPRAEIPDLQQYLAVL
jgi:hypothetical protein